MKKYVVTGGAGFIGSHITEYLLKAGHQVTVIDSLRTGFEKNLKGLNARFFEEDIRNKDLVGRIIIDTDCVFHLAALVSVPESLLRMDECIEINTLGTLNVLEAARKNDNCKVVLSSSAANYGDNPILPKVESMFPEPMTPYAITKLDGEYYLRMYYDQYNLQTASLRYFNVFGPRQNPKSAYAAAVPIFINKALKNEPITIYGDGLQTRDFIYVKDVVRANVLASEKGNETYNVALGHSTSILELAEKIIEITNSKSEIQFLEERPGDIKHSKADPSKFNQIGFKPQYTIEKALLETIASYENELYDVYFFIPEGKVLASYDEKGVLLRTAERYKDIKLPISVSNAISKRFPNWSTSKNVYLVNYHESGKTRKLYKIALENGKQRIRVKVDDTGKFL